MDGGRGLFPLFLREFPDCRGVMRSRYRGTGAGGIGGSRSVRWRGRAGSFPLQTCTGSGAWGVGDTGPNPSSGPCSTCCVCRCGPMPSSGPLRAAVLLPGGGGCNRCHRRPCCRAWWAGQHHGWRDMVCKKGDTFNSTTSQVVSTCRRVCVCL